MNRKIAFLFMFVLALTLAPQHLHADKKTPDPNIVSDILSDSVNIIVQPSGLLERLNFKAPVQTTKPSHTKPTETKKSNRAGFRVQIFSDNNPTNAKNNARARIRQVSSRFPQYRTYLDYASPYWKARVGDFKTQADANAAASKIRGAFPSFSNEIRVVKDNISIFE